MPFPGLSGWLHPPQHLGLSLPQNARLPSPCTDNSTSAPAVPASLVAWQAKRPAWSSSTWSMRSVVPCEVSCTPASSSAGRPFCSQLRCVGRGTGQPEAREGRRNRTGQEARQHLSPVLTSRAPWPLSCSWEGKHLPSPPTSKACSLPVPQPTSSGLHHPIRTGSRALGSLRPGREGPGAVLRGWSPGPSLQPTGAVGALWAGATIGCLELRKSRPTALPSPSAARARPKLPLTLQALP